MRYIVITLPEFFDGEAQAITDKFEAGLEILHLRKPGSTVESMRALLDAIPARWHGRIVIHDHFELIKEYGLKGVHLSSRNPLPPTGWTGHVSTSCHSIDELARRKSEGYAYLSLSPIFDSVSKVGYKAAFTPEQLRQAAADGIIDSSVMALGGITRDNTQQAIEYGFGGVMVLGDAWRKPY